MDAPIEDLRRDPSTMAGVGITEITNHYNSIIRTLDTPPIIMGHSFGGVVTQLLLDRDLGAAGVAIHPAPVKGVLRLPLSALRSAFPVLGNPLKRNRAVALTPKQFHYAFTNTMSEEESQAVYERYHVPGTGRVLFQAATANLNPRAVTKVDFKSARPAPRCWWWAAARTTPFRPRCPKRLPRARARPSRSPSTGSTQAARITRWARRDGRRSPTTLSSGPPSTSRPALRPERTPDATLPTSGGPVRSNRCPHHRHSLRHNHHTHRRPTQKEQA